MDFRFSRNKRFTTCAKFKYKKVRKKKQERALRFIYNDYNSDYDTLLLNSKMPTLRLRRLRTMALAFKILNHPGPVYLNDLLNFKNHK